MSRLSETEILKDLKEISEQLGKFPTHGDLFKLKRSDLRYAILCSNKKISEYAEILGIKPKQKKRNFWNSNTIKEELMKICNELGHFPTQDELNEMGLTSLVLAMWKNGEPIQFWQDLLGYNHKTKPKGYWTEENIIKEFNEFAELYEFFPTQAALRNNGKYDLTRAIDRSGKGIAYFQKIAGFEPKFEATDGHILDSSYELMLDEWLYKHGIRHDVHGYINREYGRYRYDFKLSGNVFVEIWGYTPENMADFAVEYNEKRALKQKLYEQLKFNVIGVEASMFIGSEDDINDRIRNVFGKFI